MEPIATAPKDGTEILVWGPKIGFRPAQWGLPHYVLLRPDFAAKEKHGWQCLDGMTWIPEGLAENWTQLPKSPIR